MDVSDISKVASRKRMNTDAEKLREKVSRETAKIIKLKVAQDTAYWDLKEKLQQLEANHERLQQNMVEVQMQHEAISGQYQEELRLRPDTLNKLGGTREICDVLEEYFERLRRTVTRCRSDQLSLQNAYGACGDRVKRLAIEATRAKDIARTRADEARSALERHEADTMKITLTAEQLGAVRARCDMLEEVRRGLSEQLERYGMEMRQREENSAATQAEVDRLQRKLDAKTIEVEQIVAKHDAEMQASRAAIDKESALRHHAEQRLAQLQELLDEAKQHNDTLNKDYQDGNAVIERLQIEVAVLARDKERLENALKEREQQLLSYESELHQAKGRISSLEIERQKETEKLHEALQRGEHEASRAEQLAHRADTLQEQANKALQDHANHQAEAERRISELQIQLSDRCRDLHSKTDTITRLMGDLKAEAEARTRSETTLNTTRQQYDSERSAGDAARADLSATIQRLETTARTKDEEISVQKTVIQEIRMEKDRLQERIRAMQSTINNIQQELTGRAAPPAAPTAPTAAERERDALLYSYMSDGSVDGDALDVLEVNRRFEALARGDRQLPPLRLHRSHGSKKSLSQAKKDSNLQSRRFFKSKPLDAKEFKSKE